MQATLSPSDRTTDPSAAELSLSVEELGRTLEAFFRQRQLAVAVRCALQGDRLLVVGNHRTDMSLNPRQVLQLLEARIHALQIRSIQQVGLYLRIVGQPKPYVRRQFSLNQTPPKPVLSGVAASAIGGTGAIAPPVTIPIPKPASVAPSARTKAPPIPPTTSRPPVQSVHAVQKAVPQAPKSAQTPHQSPQKSVEAGADHRLLIAGIGAVGLALGSYVLTQPCTLGACPQLETAKSLGSKSFTVVTQAPAAPDLAAAQQYLTGAINLLDTVPIWSRHRSTSNELRQQYQQQNEVLNGLRQAEQWAIAATQASEAPVLNLQTWQLIRNQWEAAIQQLEAVPVASPFYATATAKLQDYRDQLALVQTRLQQEEAAGQRLSEAKQLLKLAWERQQHAIHQKRPDLAEAVVATWEAGLARLQQVPPNTSAMFEAERLLALYEPRVEKIKTDLEAAIAQAANQPAQPMLQIADPSAAPDTQPVAQPMQAIAPQAIPQPIPQLVPQQIPPQALSPQQMAQYQMAQQQMAQQRMMQQQMLQQPLRQQPISQRQLLQQQMLQQHVMQQMQGQPISPVQTVGQ
ncbi:hypothetical protein [Thermoleptolyngbya sp. M55_K2018_002]|uniref:hypothetical protein n=1 Tax=Thermoleptolyngbya sp. M55_K2018_002 TaxID=2747808 RepID=UPI0019E17F39|nr:hypothetical protein [Thermoleptolyngbya sp. M55_K2018_002]HIK39004.1 hypothetical protein [Thermoleptolyngbya sp. M55_K2018_002]